MPARSVWTGTIHLGLLTIPCRAHPATRDHDVSFSTYDTRDGAALGRAVVNKDTGEEVPTEHQGRRVRWADAWVPVTDAQLAVATPPELGREVRLDGFVDAAELDPRGMGKCYDLTPDRKAGGADSGYTILAAALDRTGRAGVGTWTYRSRARLAVIRSHAGRLTVTEYAWADELDAHALDDEPGTLPEVADVLVEHAVRLVDELTAPWVHDHADPRHAAIVGMLDSLAAGADVAATPVPDTPKVDDLLAALEASVAAAKAAA